MPVRRGLVPSALITSTIVLLFCAVGWGALGVIAFDSNVPVAVSRYLSLLVAVSTICAVTVNLSARVIRAIRDAAEGYAAGYTDGVDAQPGAPVSPVVSRLARTLR